MTGTYTLTIHADELAFTAETFEADPRQISTESTENGERITVYGDGGGPDNLILEAFVPNGTPYTLRKED